MRTRTGRWIVIVVCGAVSCAALSCSSETAPPPSAPIPEPQQGQKGKDVVWVPTPELLVERMLDVADLTTSDYLIDLGSGDGRLVIAAARRGARAKGIEFNPDLVAHSRQQAERAGLSWKASFEVGDIFTSDLSQATVITLFLSSEINLKLRPRLLDLEPGTRIVTNTFEMADWEPDKRAQAGDCGSWCDALLWIIPAKVAGRWSMDGQPMVLEQKFQRVLGTLANQPIEDARLRGSTITFRVGAERYRGEVEGDRMTGERDDRRAWSARRASRSGR
jgi:hypothetical protein